MTGEHEKSYDEIFRDPIILMLMKSDRIAPEDARQLFSEVADRIRRRRMGLRNDETLHIASLRMETRVA
jgi:hypothetical protein